MFEVICVDDRSSDKTVEVLRRTGLNHSNLRILFNKENLRAGGARNHGVREAKGEYIVFIDADDYFHPGALLKIIDIQLNKKLDILMCDFARHSDNEANNDLVHNFKHQEIMSGREFMLSNSLPYAPWKYVFKRSLMVDNHVWFEEKVSCEDIDWTHHLALYAKSMQYLPILLVHYILIPTSQTATEYKNASTVFNKFLAGKRLMELTTLCTTDSERAHIHSIASGMFHNGILFLNFLAISPKRKIDIIKNTIDRQYDWQGLIKYVLKFPRSFAIGSTALAPLAKLLLYFKHKYLGRR